MIIDTDGGVDDAMAIILAVRSPEVDLRAITTVAGNTNVEQATRNVFTVLEIADATVPEVAIGAARPIIGPTLDAGTVHGNDGLGGLDRFMNADGSPRYPAPESEASDRTAVEVLLDAARTYGRELTLISIGPLTNIALAVREDPQAMSSIGSMVTMGGATSVPGNVSPTAEFNIWADPEGAAIALDSMPHTTLVGLDVTHQVPLFRDFVAQRHADQPTKVTLFVRDCTEFYINFYRDNEGPDCCYLHDPLAMAVAIDPTLVTCEALKVDVETRGEHTRGMVVGDRRSRRNRMPAQTIEVALQVDSDRMLAEYFSRIV